MSSIAILGCARNIAKYWNESVSTLKTISNQFQSYKIIIFENDSSDNSLLLLKHFEQSFSHVSILSEKNLTKQIPIRTHRLAYCRQKLLNHLINTNFNPEYVCVLDLDDVCNQFRAQSFIKKSFQLNKDWDAIFPSSSYDYWAWRTEICKLNYKEQRILKNIKYLNLLKQDMNLKPRDPTQFLRIVLSAFGGIGLYKYKVYIKGKYDGRNFLFSNVKNGQFYHNEECEHVNFHHSLGQNTRIRVITGLYYTIPGKNNSTKLKMNLL